MHVFNANLTWFIKKHQKRMWSSCLSCWCCIVSISQASHYSVTLFIGWNYLIIIRFKHKKCKAPKLFFSFTYWHLLCCGFWGVKHRRCTQPIVIADFFLLCCQIRLFGMFPWHTFSKLSRFADSSPKQPNLKIGLFY